VDPILWTKNSHSLATLLQVFLTGNFALLLPWQYDFRYWCGAG